MPAEQRAFIDIALLCGLWNFQVPMWLLKIKNSFIEEIEKTTFDLIKSLVFKKVPSQKILSLQPNIFNWVLLRRIWGKRQAGNFPVLLFQSVVNLI